MGQSVDLFQCAIVSDTHLAPPGAADGRWNNVTRKSIGADLLEALVSSLRASGQHRVLLLGDVSDTGEPQWAEQVLRVLSRASISCWVVPGNHDVAVEARVVAHAATAVPRQHAIEGTVTDLGAGLLLAGHGIESDDGGDTCRAVRVPGTFGASGTEPRLLLWASHHPLFSERSRLAGAGLRYSGDLENRADVEAAALGFGGPILALHGHLHTWVTSVHGRVLQLGVPAVVEWPHAWTDLQVEADGERLTVRAAVRTLPGAWSACDVDTMLDPAEQSWQLGSTGWVTAPG